MNLTVLGILTVCSYLTGTWQLFKHRHSTMIPPQIRIWTGLAWVGHLGFITLNSFMLQGVDFGVLNSAAIVAAWIVLLFLLASIYHPIDKLGLVILPTAAFMLAADALFPQSLHKIPMNDWQMMIHIFSSMMAFSLFSIAAFQALLLAIQEQQLKHQRMKFWLFHLPALQTMETLLFQMLTIGLLFLSLSLISGIVFIQDLFAQHLVHKTVLSLFAWLIFSGLLWGRWQYGWRGLTAIRWTFSGFVLLLLAYFGSKIVLEMILHKY
ncbi:MAG: hypothetical protein RL637_543 [Pseudomonadota bacterium]|jgi:ABC-type uncharacterized transport system permease subunit